MSADLKSVLIGLDTIRRQADHWVEYNTASRAREGLESTDDTYIMAPPHWPSHGQLRAWSKVLTEAADALASKDEEIAALRLFVAQCDALFEAMQADAFIFPNKFGSLATYRAVARSLQGDADVSRGGGDG
mgnify:CR=1 FL=1